MSKTRLNKIRAYVIKFVAKITPKLNKLTLNFGILVLIWVDGRRAGRRDKQKFSDMRSAVVFCLCTRVQCSRHLYVHHSMFLYFSSRLGADEIKRVAESVSFGWKAKYGAAIHWKDLAYLYDRHVSSISYI